MYCKYCGKKVPDESAFCDNCGGRLDPVCKQTDSDDKSSFWLGVAGFIIPLLGLVLFLVYEGKKPKRARSAGKGALIGFITKLVLSIILVIISLVYSSFIIHDVADNIGKSRLNIPEPPTIGTWYQEESTEDINKLVDVTFGKFQVSENEILPETSLEITVKNKAADTRTYFITVEAVDADGTRIATDMVLADNLRPGQSVKLAAFKYVEEEKISQFKNASFQVLEIY